MNKKGKNIIAKAISLLGAVGVGFISGGYLFVYKLGVVSNVHGFPEGNIIQSQMNWFYISVGLAAVVTVCLYVVSVQLFRHKGLLALYSFYISLFLVWFVLRDFVIVINKNTPNMFLGHDISWVLQFFYRPTHIEYVIDDRRFDNITVPLLW